MWQKSNALAGVLTLICLSACTRPAPPPGSVLSRTSDKIIRKNTDVMIAYWQWINIDCSISKYQVLQMERAPAHGHAYFTDYATYPHFPANNPRSRCNSTEVVTTSLHYQPDPAFTGFDFIPVTVGTPTGTARNVAFRIRVID